MKRVINPLYKNRDWLYQAYIIDGQTCFQIAIKCNCHYRTIHQNLINHQILRRKPIEWADGNYLVKWYECYPEARHQKKKKWADEQKQKQSLKHKGEGNPNWKGGLTAIVRGIRRSPEYYQWRKSVLRRDSFTCQKCGFTGKGIEAHHIKTIFQCPELVFNVNNGEALCKTCHKELNFYSGRSNR